MRRMVQGFLILMMLVSCAVAGADVPPAPDAPEPALDSRRLVRLEGTHNLRDLGGYPTSDGRRVKWGQVYRSDALHELTDRDLEALAERGLKTIVDLRGADERLKEPSRVPPSVTTVRFVELKEGGVNAEAFTRRMMSGEMSRDESRQFLLDGYLRNVDEGGPTLGVILEALARGDQAPLLFHCTAGKDRTGVVAAVLLSLLGVPRDLVVEDYVVTEHFRADRIEQALAQIAKAAPPAATEAFKARLARPEYILHALARIDDEYGGIEAYARNQMGLDDETIARLRARYLE